MKSANPEAFVLIRQSRAHRLLTSFVVAAIVFLYLLGNTSNLSAMVNHKDFPTFPAIQTNVAFWEKIYTRYSTSEAVIHDKYDLTKIYGVIPIVDYLQPGAAQLNKPLLETAKQKYSAILTHIAQGGPPTTKEERRIAAMYQGARKSQLQKASESVRIQIGQKERFREGVVRSGAYLHEIKRILRSYDLPEELAYLPHVESSFNPDAYSKAGASGLWQFTRSTGKQYLRIDHTIDERQDPFRATHAAAKFLKRNHSVLGSWPLALTAYNYGTSGMARAKKDKGSYEKIFLEYEEGHFKFASRNYYPEFLAALQAAQKLEQNLSLRPLQSAPMTTIRLTKRASIDDISRHFKVDINTIKTLNPAINKAISQEKKQLPQGYELKLPATIHNSKKQTVATQANPNDQKNRSQTIVQK
jgi:membrane-bound lytic murein transglycosylase D